MTRVLLLALSALTACGAPTPTPAVDAGACVAALAPGAALEDGGFEPFLDGQDVPLVYGPQGGVHLSVTAHAEGLPRAGLLTWTLRSSDGERLSGRSFDLANVFLVDVACGWERRDDALVFLDAATAQLYRGKTVGLELELGALKRSVTLVPR